MGVATDHHIRLTMGATRIQELFTTIGLGWGFRGVTVKNTLWFLADWYPKPTSRISCRTFNAELEVVLKLTDALHWKLLNFG